MILFSKKIYILLLSFFLFSTTFTIYAENKYVLENGMEVNIMKDLSTPTVTCLFVVKAGYSVQTPQTAGFIKLFAKLFLSSEMNRRKLEAVGVYDIDTECLTDCVIYSFSFHQDSIEKALTTFAQIACYPVFSNTDITTAYTELCSEYENFFSSTEGFINCAVDSKILSSSPWKLETGVNNTFFTKLSAETIRAELYNIARNFYSPDNSALFLASPLDIEFILDTIKTSFTTWVPSFARSIDSQKSNYINSNTEATNQKKFVLVSDDFSPDYTQTIIQYTTEGLFSSIKDNATMSLSADILENGLYFKDIIVNNKETGITKKEYINSSISQSGSFSRLVIQALSVENSNESSACTVVNNIENTLLSFIESDKLQNDLIEAKKRIKAENSKTTISIRNYLYSQASTWAYSGTDFFNAFPVAVASIKQDDIISALNKKPFIFILAHPSTFKRNYNDFITNGYSIIKAEEFAFPTSVPKENINQIANNKMSQEKNDTIYSDFIIKNKEQISSFILENNIKAVIKNTSSGTGCTIMIALPRNFDPHKRITSSLALQLVVSEISNQLNECNLLSLKPEVIITNTITENHLVINTVASDIQTILNLVSKTFMEGKITPFMADEIFYKARLEYNSENSSLEKQISNTGFETLFTGTPAVGLFTFDESEFLKIKFSELATETTLLDNPNNIKIIICGNLDLLTKPIITILQNSFGKFSLNNQEPTKSNSVPIPEFSNTTRYVRLRRTFLSDTPDKKNTKRPDKLIPTTIFFDPVSIFFESPSPQDSDFPIFETILMLLEKKLKQKWQDGVTVSISNTEFFPPIVQVSFLAVPKQVKPLILVKETIKELTQTLTKYDIEELKTLYAINTIAKDYSTEYMVHLINNSIMFTGKPTIYLDWYETVMKATMDDFIRVATYLQNINVFLTVSSSE